MKDIDRLAADIRAIDGAHSLGAGALAEALIEKGWRAPAKVQSFRSVSSARNAEVGHLVRSRWSSSGVVWRIVGTTVSRINGAEQLQVVSLSSGRQDVRWRSEMAIVEAIA